MGGFLSVLTPSIPARGHNNRHLVFSHAFLHLFCFHTEIMTISKQVLPKKDLADNAVAVIKL